MHQEIHQSPLAIAYAQALLDLGQRGEAMPTAIGDELRDLRQIIDADPPVRPGAGRSRHQPRGARPPHPHASSTAGPPNSCLNFLGLVNEKGRLNLLPAIAAAYDDLLDQQQGNIEVDVTVAHKLNDEQLESVRRTVSEALKRNAVVHSISTSRSSAASSSACRTN